MYFLSAVFQTLLRVFDVCGHGYNNVVGSSFGRVHVLQPTKHLKKWFYVVQTYNKQKEKQKIHPESSMAGDIYAYAACTYTILTGNCCWFW